MTNASTRRSKPRAMSLLAGLAALAVLATPTLGAAQDLDQNARQRLFSSIKPAVVFIASQVEAQITIPMDDGTSLQLQTSTAGTGSGWIITPDGFIVTNAHVVEMYHESNETQLRQFLLYQALRDAGFFNQIDPNTGRIPTESEAVQQTLEIYPSAGIVLKKDLVAVLQNGRSLEASVREYSPPAVAAPGKISVPGAPTRANGRDVAILKVSGRDLPTMNLGDSDRTAIGEQIFVAGYPGVAYGAQLDQASILEASFTSGQISSLKAAVGGEELIQVDAPSSSGSSGGPVFNRTGEVVGILTMGNSEVFGFAVTSNTIRDFFRASGGVVGESLFDRTWERALDDYYAGNWDAAVGGFDEALRVMPDLPDALSLRRTAMANRDDGTTTQVGDEGGLPTWAMGLIALGVVLLGAGLVMRREPATAAAAGGAGGAARGSASATVAAATPKAPGHLRVTAGALHGNRFEIGADGIRIGRDPDACQIVVSDASVSREHAVIRPNGSSLRIKNLSGTNPTYVNDRSIQEATLATGDRVKIGDSVFQVEA